MTGFTGPYPDLAVERFRIEDGYINNRWYGPVQNGAALGSAAVTARRLYAIPYIECRGGLLRELGIWVTAQVVGNARFGIYHNKGGFKQPYPGDLVSNGVGAVSVNSTGIRSVDFTQQLAPGTLYWLAVMTENGVTPTVKTYGANHFIGINGCVNTDWDVQGVGWYSDLGADAIPDPFPAGGTELLTSATVPAIKGRYLG